MDDLIAVVNRLQEVLATFGESRALDLPQLVAVGSQSAGKSSCLEQLVGRDFLPKGSGVVTRTPLVLQLLHTPKTQPQQQQQQQQSQQQQQKQQSQRRGRHAHHDDSDREDATAGLEYGEFLHMKTRLYSFEDIKHEIERETARLAGGGKAISREAIYLKIYSPNVLNLTVIDLPGLTKIPVGDQPSDIEMQVKNLVLDYISNPNCLILAVSPANVDLANSDSLKLARKVDPEGKRTIGLLTKLDLMDSGTDALDILRGKTYPLRYGFIGVVNRSQQDINKQKSMVAARRDESEFFATHPLYYEIADRCGTDHLITALNSILLEHIRAKMPEIKSKLTRLITQTQHELVSYGDPQTLSPAHKGSMLLRLLTRYATDFNAAVEGTMPPPLSSAMAWQNRSNQSQQAHSPSASSPVNSPNLAQHLLDRRHTVAHHPLQTSHSPGGYPTSSSPSSATFASLSPQQQQQQQISQMFSTNTSYQAELASELSGGARIYHVFTTIFGSELEGLDSCGDLMTNDIRTAIRNATGPRPALFVPEAAFDLLVKPQIARLEAPSLRCVELVFDELVKITYNCCPTELKRYSRLRERIVSIVIELLRERMAPTSTYVESLVSIQKAYINTNHPDFIGGGQAVAMLEKQMDRKRRHGTRARRASIGSNASVRSTDHRHATRPISMSSRDMLMGTAMAMPSTSLSSNHSSSSMETIREHTQPPLLEAAVINGTLRSQMGPISLGRAAGGGALASLAAAHSSSSGLAEVVRLDMAVPFPTREADMLTDREDFEIQLIRTLIVSYFAIVRKTMSDLVPKAIMHLMVNYVRESLQNRLVQSLYREEMFSELLHEDESLTQDREKCKANLEMYKKAFAQQQQQHRRTLAPCIPVEGAGLGYQEIPPPFLDPQDVPLYCHIKRIDPSSDEGQRVYRAAQVAARREAERLRQHAKSPPPAQTATAAAAAATAPETTTTPDEWTHCIIPLKPEGGVTGMEMSVSTNASYDLNVFGDERLARSIMQLKTSLGLVGDTAVKTARAAANPYENIGRAGFINRAAVKLAEIDHFAGLCTRLFARSEATFVDMCAGQGGFSEYTLFRAVERGVTEKVQGFAMTLSNDIPFEPAAFRVPEDVRGRVSLFEGDGDVCNTANIEALAQHVDAKCGSVGLVLSDGGFSTRGAEEKQELQATRLKICESLAMFCVLGRGGDFVLKIYDALSPVMASLLYLLYRHFDDCAIVKPRTSRPANSERYLICRGLKAHKPGRTIAFLKDVNEHLRRLESNPADSTVLRSIVALEVIKQERRFRDYLRRTNSRHASSQLAALKALQDYISNPAKPALTGSVEEHVRSLNLPVG
ncbi:Dynamin- GTPase protein [Sorochytrium milnesiophthora]